VCITCCNTVTNAIVLLERRLFVEAQNGIMFNTNRSEARHNFCIGFRICDKLSRMSLLMLLRPGVL
jgi:hypothetical protein